uniref:Uncharacterized protein n=1 Tax=Yersinia enterocolitica W22703 TaxID=913028 RepID=F4MZ84_YEREN|nr:hypothetical protein YEW_CF09370 [Yersinia enterocolitica W22703]
MAASSNKKLSLWSLTSLVVGSMIGAGIFSLPATFGRATGGFGALIAWVIAGGGMLTLALFSRHWRSVNLNSILVFIFMRKPDLVTMPVLRRLSVFGLVHVSAVSLILY